MQVLKIQAEGVVTSFRYPHFMQSIHPSYEMPPPATIYGHICSVLGEWIDPKGLLFAYKFTYRCKVDDLEHIHVLTHSSGRLKNFNAPKVLEGNTNPFKRTLLFEPRLTLYLNKPEWDKAFKSPKYPVVLGRSQDLFTYTDVKVIELRQEQGAYFENTLAPYSMILEVGKGIVELMPRYLNYHVNREPIFSRYLLIKQRIKSTDLLQYNSQQYLVDPDSPEYDGLYFGTLFHSLIGDEYESIEFTS
ncbi:MAG: type I-B CRISPR-associated protein Cas5b [Bacillota bacterium]